MVPPATFPPSWCDRAARESNNDRCARVRVRVRARVQVHLRGHLERARCWLRERGGKGNNASLDRFMRGRSVGVRKPKETGSSGGARARAGRLGWGWGWRYAGTLGVPLSPAERALPLVPPAAAPPSCSAGCETGQLRVCEREGMWYARAGACANADRVGVGWGGQGGVTLNARGAGRASGEERAIVRGWTDSDNWEEGASV